MNSAIENTYEAVDHFSAMVNKDGHSAAKATTSRTMQSQVQRKKVVAWCISTTSTVFCALIAFILAFGLALSAVVLLAVYIPRYEAVNAASSQEFQAVKSVLNATAELLINTFNEEILNFRCTLNTTVSDLQSQMETLSLEIQDLQDKLNMEVYSLQSELNNTTTELQTRIDSFNQVLQTQLNTTSADLQTQIDSSNQALQTQLNITFGNFQTQIDSSNQALQTQLNITATDLHTLIDVSNQALQMQLSNLSVKYDQQIMSFQTNLNKSIVHIEALQSFLCPGLDFSQPASSCMSVMDCNPSSPSGNYWIETSTGNAVLSYCDMTRTCGGITGGWMRIMTLDMRVGSAQCPSGLTERVHPGQRLCGRNIDGGGCSQVHLETNSVQYSRVCGKVIAYQFASPDAFFTSSTSIESAYVDGISLTFNSNPRQHIWSFVTVLDTLSGSGTPPSFVGNDYFCDTGSNGPWSHVLYANDPLWDGVGCGSIPCCSLNNPPWFYKELVTSITQDMELRLCCDQERTDEDVLVEQVEIYVQ